jgi:hypothetical protein
VSRTRYLKTFASRKDDGTVNVFIINKDTQPHTLSVVIKNSTTSYQSGLIHEFSGTGPSDMNPQWNDRGSKTVTGNRIDNITVPSISITVVICTPAGTSLFRKQAPAGIARHRGIRLGIQTSGTGSGAGTISYSLQGTKLTDRNHVCRRGNGLVVITME